MLHARTRHTRLTFFALLLSALALLPAARAQGPADTADDQPPFREYKGVRIGMPAAEARKLLGNPTDKDDKQEVFSLSDQETCQLYYDGEKRVSAVSITYSGGKAIPTAKAVLGDEAETRKDGSAHRLIRFPKAGYWVSYTRTSGDSPLTVIAIQKLQP